jgi:hypothetical protein
VDLQDSRGFTRMEDRSCLVGNVRRPNTGLAPGCSKSKFASNSCHFNVFINEYGSDNRSGMHEVGILTGILRKLQHWNLSSILFEYRSFAGPNARFNEEQFIELFDETALVLPSHLPTWWEEQQELWRTNHIDT